MARKKKQVKAQNGDGSFRIKPSGLIEYRFCYRDEYDQRQRKSVSGETEQECLDKAEEFLAGRAKLNKELDANSSIVDILRYKYRMDYEKNFLSDAGYGRNLDNVKIIEKGPIGCMPIVIVEKKHIDMYLKDITRYSNSVIEKIFLQLKLAFSIATEEGLITYNPMLSHSIRRPKSVRADKKVRGLSAGEQKKLVDAMDNKNPPKGRNDYRLQLFIELYSGLRMGEINALTLKDIDFENNVIHVRGTISKDADNKFFLKESTKTEAGMRDVPISSSLKPYLEDAVRKYRRNKENLLFYDHVTKTVISTNQVNSYYKRICRIAGITSDGQHALRHTFATRCIESGVPAVVLKTWLGHTDIHVTLDTYTDVFKSMDNDAINKFDAHLDMM